jgi:hypothetical protein
MREAFTAGYTPNSTPTATGTPNATTTHTVVTMVFHSAVRAISHARKNRMRAWTTRYRMRPAMGQALEAVYARRYIGTRMAISDADERARENLGKAIDATHRFPQYVFRGDWERFLFFDSDWLFGKAFVEIAKTLMQSEGSSSVCLTDFDSELPDQSSFWIRKETTSDDYLAAFAKLPVGGVRGWLWLISRYGCTSDVCEWCLYCERQNEVAVMALRKASFVEKYTSAIKQLEASPIDLALESPPSWVFAHLVPEWREGLLKHYRNEPTTSGV